MKFTEKTEKIILLASKSTEEITRQCIKSIIRCGVDSRKIIVYAPKGFECFFDTAKVDIEELERRGEDDHEPSGYSNYGTKGFNQFTYVKWLALEHAIKNHAGMVVYSDIDILWLKSPVNYLWQSLVDHDISIQSECTGSYPPKLCTGFIALKKSEKILRLIEGLKRIHQTAIQRNLDWNDQDTINSVYTRKMIRHISIHVLPESSFPVGRITSLFSDIPSELAAILRGQPDPYIYHGNWTIGLKNKQILLAFAQQQSDRLEAAKIGLHNSSKDHPMPSASEAQKSLSIDRQKTADRDYTFISHLTKVIIFESTPSTPHVETGLEIALRCAEFCSDCYYAPLYISLSTWESFILENPYRIHALKEQIITNSKLVLSKSQVRVLAANNVPRMETLIIPSTREIYDSALEDFPIGRYIRNTIAFLSKSSNINIDSPDTAAIAKLLYAIGYQSYFLSKHFLDSTKPNLAFIFNGRFVTTAASKWACKSSNIRYMLHERGAVLDKFQIADESLHSVAESMRRIENYANGASDVVRAFRAHQFYSKRKSGLNTNWKSYTSAQERGVVPNSLGISKSLVYFVSSDDEFAFLGSDFDIGLGDQKAAFLKLKHLCDELGIRVFLRLHPRLSELSPAESQFWFSQSSRIVEVIPPDSTIDSYQLAASCDIVATFSSTMGIEASYMLKPTIALGKTWYSEDEIMRPTSTSQLRHFLEQPRIPKTRCGAEAYGYYMDDYGIPFVHFKPDPDTLFSGTIKDIRIM